MPQKRFTKTLILALLTGALFRLLFIGRAPGLHFDEAWAANYAYKIASVPGFWPIDAMSPYTHPWSHYVTAAFFKLLGPHLWVVRLAGTMMSGFGIILIAKTLGALGETKAQAYFACLAAACFASVANERFAIEINTFHVLCLGLLVYGVVLKRWLFIGASAVFGVTSHILFLAPLLAAFWVWAASDRKDKKDRVFIGMICVLLLPFFFSVYLEIPEKGKALTVILVDLLALIYVIHPFSVGFIERRLRWLLLPVVSVFLLIIGAMMEGDLSVAFTHGMISSNAVSILSIAFAIAGSIFLLSYAWKQIYSGAWPRHFAQWFFYTVFLAGVISTKPAPRYFEMIFILALVGTALTLSRISSRKLARIFLSIFFLVSLLQWSVNYIQPALHHAGIDRSFRYLIFHDNSSDSLSKQNLVAELGFEGCSPEQVITSDPRINEALRFLAVGDWKTDREKNCPSQKIEVERAQTGAKGRRFEEFVLQ